MPVSRVSGQSLGADCEAVERAFRGELGVIVAALARRLGDLQAAQDAAAEAFAAAADAWARDGIPPNPGGWLMLTAWRKAVDARRRDSAAIVIDPWVLSEAGMAGSMEPTGEATSLGDERQDRGTWDKGLIAAGTAVLDAAMAQRSPGPYQVQAAIAALHAGAARYAGTHWQQIALLYGELARMDPSPVIEVNRAVAVGMADGPLSGLAVLDPLLAAGERQGYAPLYAALADLLDRAGYRERSREAWQQAAALAGNTTVAREIRLRYLEEQPHLENQRHLKDP
jgi:predicted RNA polymerase sigma factor